MKKLVSMFFVFAVILFTACTPTENTPLNEEGLISVSVDSTETTTMTPTKVLVPLMEHVAPGERAWNIAVQEFNNGYAWRDSFFQWPENAYLKDRITYNEKGESILTWHIGEPYVNPNSSKATERYLKVPHTTKVVTQKITTTATKESNLDSYLPFWLSLFLLIGVLFWIFMLNKVTKKRTKEMEDGYLKNIIHMEEEIFELKNKLPIEIPKDGIVDEEWLKTNHPIADPIESGLGEGHIAMKSLNTKYGKKPDLILKTLFSGESPVNMDFSHNRNASVKLNNVTTYVGWAWEKNRWKEVGMVVGACQNCFEFDTTQVKKISEKLSNFKLIDDRQHPVVFEKISGKNPRYPELVKKLVLEYQAENIADIERAGAIVDLNPQKAPRKKTRKRKS